MERSQIKIRVASSEDLYDVARIWQRGSFLSLGIDVGDSDGEKYLLDCITDQSHIFKFWVATDSRNKVLGWQSLRPTDANPFTRNLVAISSTYVDLDCGLKGVGTQLVKEAMRHADDSPLHYIFARASLTNDRIRSMAANLGWTIVGGVPQSQKTPPIPETFFLVYVSKSITNS